MKSHVIKRSIVVEGHKTSVSLEDEFWTALKEIAAERRQTLSELVGHIDSGARYFYAFGRQLLDGLRHRVRVACADCQGHALIRQQVGNGAAYAAGSACDDGLFSR